MVNLDQFIATWDGKYADFDGWYGAQCVDLAQYWSQALGGPRFTGNAADIFGEYPDFYDSITNTPSGVPQPGDIMIWGSNLNGGPGHIAIFVSGNTSSFSSFDQNWPLNSACHIQYHDYNYVVGWLRPKNYKGENMDELSKQKVDVNRRDMLERLTFPPDRLPSSKDFSWGVGGYLADVIDAISQHPDRLELIYPEVVADRDSWASGPKQQARQAEVDKQIADLKQQVADCKGVSPDSITVTKDSLWTAIKKFFGK